VWTDVVQSVFVVLDCVALLRGGIHPPGFGEWVIRNKYGVTHPNAVGFTY
jgi:hypothetical protein